MPRPSKQLICRRKSVKKATEIRKTKRSGNVCASPSITTPPPPPQPSASTSGVHVITSAASDQNENFQGVLQIFFKINKNLSRYWYSMQLYL